MRVVFAALLLLVAHPAYAGIIVAIERSGVSVDFPLISMLAEDGPMMTGFRLTIGDMSANFDSAQDEDLLLANPPILLSPDALNSALRSDVLEWTFPDFSTGSFFSSKIDIDRDAGAATVDWQTVLFNNGALPNAELTVTWNNGTQTLFTFPDDPERDPLSPYMFRVTAVPEPATCGLLAIGMLSLIVLRKVRRRI